MKRARFKEGQIISVLKEHEVFAKTVDPSRERGIAETSLSNWRATLGCLDVHKAKQLKRPDKEPRQVEVDCCGGV